MNKKEKCVLKVFRFDPDVNVSPFFQEFVIPFEAENTILDSLYYIYRHIDSSLAFRGSCFAGGWCHVCMVKVNGKVLLPCKHFIEKEMTIEPLPGYPVIRDLVVDFSTRKRKKINSKDDLKRE